MKSTEEITAKKTNRRYLLLYKFLDFSKKLELSDDNGMFFVVSLNLKKLKKFVNLLYENRGGVAEWLKAAVLKTVELVRVPWVRILPPPPHLKERWPSWLKALAC